MAHLVVSISAHGFGHVAQTAPILNMLYQRMHALRLTVRSNVPLAHLRSRIRIPFNYLPDESEICMVMSSALDVKSDESCRAYQKFHANWDKHVEVEAGLLCKLDADMVISNVGYLPLAGAQQAGIPNAALCSLNWADIYRHYCGNDEIAAQIRSCYAGADAFLRATPGMAMADLPNLVPISPIAAVGNNRRGELNSLLKLSKEERLILVSMGGIANRLPLERWPRLKGVRWLVQQGWQIDHPNAIEIESLPMSFNDLLASSDVLVCKPGYGSFVEAVCSGVPVIYVDRADWPESSPLIDWLKQHGISREISRSALEEGNIADLLEIVGNLQPINRVVPSGVVEVANWLGRKMDF